MTINDILAFLGWWLVIGLVVAIAFGRWIGAAKEGPPVIVRDEAAIRRARAVIEWEATHCCRCSARLRDDGFTRRNDGNDMCVSCLMGEINDVKAADRAARKGGAR